MVKSMAPAVRTRRGKDKVTHTEPELSAGDIGRRAASGAALLTGKGILGQALGLLSTIFVTRLLAPDQLGLFAIAATISTFLWVLGGGLGLAGALIRRPTAPDHADLRACVALQLGLTSFMAGAVALATVPFGIVGELTAVMVATAPLTAFRSAGVVVLERQLLYKRLATAETAEMIVYYAWTIVTVVLGWGVWGLATATVARSVVGTGCIVALSPSGIVWPRYDRRRMSAMFGIGARIQLVDFVTAARDQILVLGTAVVGSVSIVAYWSLVLRALQAPGMLLWTMMRVSFPAMSRTMAAGGDPRRMLPRLLPAATILAGTLLAPLAGAAPALVPLLFGDNWLPVVNALSLACLAVVIHTPLMIAGASYLWVAGDAKTPLRAEIANAIVCIAVGLPLVPILGVLGLAVCGVAAAIVNTSILARAIDKQTDIHVFRLIRVPLLVWIVSAGTAWACAQGPGPLVVRAALSTCLAIGLYYGLLFLTRRQLMLELASDLHPRIRRRLLRDNARPAPLPTNAQA